MHIRRRWATAGLAAVAGLSAAALLVRGAIERRAAATIHRAGAAHGLTARAVRFSWTGPLVLENVALPRQSGGFTAERVELGWRLAGGRDAHRHLTSIRLRGARLAYGRLAMEWPDAAFDVQRLDPRTRTAHLRQPASGGEADVSWASPAEEREAMLSLTALDLAEARVSWAGEPILAPGRWTGRVRVRAAGARIDSEGTLAGEGTRLALPQALGIGGSGFGPPSPAALEWKVRRQGDVIEVPHAALLLAGLEASGRGRLGPAAEAEVQLSARSELAAAFAAAAVPLPAALAAASPGRLGTVSFDVSLRGPLSNPARLRIVPRLTFEPAEEATAALAFLRGPFRYRPPDAPGVEVDVREGAPGYVPLGEVPPLFLHALLISEDAGFYGHPGLDVAEVRAAWAANVQRGEMARGASTITQQLAKNLFLTQEKTYGRKLTEAALALVLDSAVPKTRLLEIYLNVIEWGPGIHGLGPAARHYFGKAPAQLTPAETAFLVCLIPSPVRYHQAHGAGRVGPGMAQLMDNLLSKLVSAQVLSEDDYLGAVGEELVFSPEGGPG
jgi:hypothetical protein